MESRAAGHQEGQANPGIALRSKLTLRRQPCLIILGVLSECAPIALPFATEELSLQAWISIVFIGRVRSGQAHYSSARASVGEIRAAW
jgi:hypothetical protein